MTCYLLLFLAVACPPVTELYEFSPETSVDLVSSTSHTYDSAVHVYCNDSHTTSGGNEDASTWSLANGLPEMFATCTAVGEWSHTFSSCSGIILGPNYLPGKGGYVFRSADLFICLSVSLSATLLKRL